MERSRGRSRRRTRIHHDERSASLLLLLKILHHRRHRFRQVAAHQKNQSSAPAMSASGNGRPRSMPNAFIAAAAADDMQNRPL